MAINKTKLVIGVTAIIAIAIVFYLLFISTEGTVFFENDAAVYYYNIEVKGLDNYTSFGVTDIIVPMPMKNDEQIFSDDELQYQSFGDWESVLVVTKQGKMLALQTTKNNLSNINARFKKYVNYSINVENPLKEILLYPVSNETSVNYTTYVYIDPKIQSKLNNSINFEITLYGEGEGARNKHIKQHRVVVHENIPESIKGPILVKSWIYS